LRSEAYTGARLNEQLADQARYVHKHDRWVQFDAGSGRLSLTRLYEWYGDDFEQVAGSVVSYVAQYSKPLKAALDAGRRPRVKWLEYDWRLNSRKHAR
jgi:hypothetical protein